MSKESNHNFNILTFISITSLQQSDSGGVFEVLFDPLYFKLDKIAGTFKIGFESFGI